MLGNAKEKRILVVVADFLDLASHRFVFNVQQPPALYATIPACCAGNVARGRDGKTQSLKDKRANRQ